MTVTLSRSGKVRAAVGSGFAATRDWVAGPAGTRVGWVAAGSQRDKAAARRSMLASGATNQLYYADFAL